MKGGSVKRVLSWLDEDLEEFLMVIFLGAMTLIMGVQVFSRYILGTSLSWSEELTRYIFIWAGFLSVSYCTKKCISIKIEQFVAVFPRRGKAAFKMANHTFELILFLYLLPFAWNFFLSAIRSGQTSPALNLPMYYVQAAPLFSFLLVSFRVAQRWWIEWNVMLGRDQKYPDKVKDPDVESGFVKNVRDEEKEQAVKNIQDEEKDQKGGSSCR